jgi:xanthine dehydrogenase YagT iron-sulfur-binding subunit
MITINGSAAHLPDDPRVSLLDLVRERLQLSGTKKGCDQGACGACTILVNCTPGQICSAVGMVEEVRRGLPSLITADLSVETITLTRDELRERMSGNLCRCGAYNGIVNAITEYADTVQ